LTGRDKPSWGTDGATPEEAEIRRIIRDLEKMKEERHFKKKPCLSLPDKPNEIHIRAE
jgi:hypothetical protein